MWEKYFLSKRSRYIFGQSYGKLTSKGVGVNKRAQPNIFSSSTCESFHSLAFRQSNATACRENESKSSFFWQTLRSLSLGKTSPQKAGNCLNEESIHISSSIVTDVDILSSLTDCSQCPLTIIIESCNRGGVIDINEVKSGEFSAAQPISSHKYFSDNQMDKHDKRQKTMGDSTRDGTCYVSIQSVK